MRSGPMTEIKIVAVDRMWTWELIFVRTEENIITNKDYGIVGFVSALAALDHVHKVAQDEFKRRALSS